jgi:hypothetical protein
MISCCVSSPSPGHGLSAGGGRSGVALSLCLAGGPGLTPGGKRTRRSRLALDPADGPFDIACRAFLAKQEGLLWGDRPVEPKSGGKRSKYVCPEDGIAAWARPGVRLLCGERSDAGVVMAKLAPTPA